MASQKPYKWSQIYDEVLDATRKIAHSKYENHLERVLSAFDTKIPVGVEEFTRGDSYVFIIGPLEGPTFTRADGEERRTSQLFQWLNEGTSVKHIRIIGDYNLESFPNSLVTISQDNSGVKIIPSKKFASDGIEPRNWLDLLEDLYRDTLPKEINSRLSRSIK